MLCCSRKWSAGDRRTLRHLLMGSSKLWMHSDGTHLRSFCCTCHLCVPRDTNLCCWSAIEKDYHCVRVEWRFEIESRPYLKDPIAGSLIVQSDLLRGIGATFGIYHADPLGKIDCIFREFKLALSQIILTVWNQWPRNLITVQKLCQSTLLENFRIDGTQTNHNQQTTYGS